MPYNRADEPSTPMTPHSNQTIEESVARITAMRKQEENGYKCVHNLYKVPAISFFKRSQETPVDADCRTKMAEWCFQVVDFCEFDRETVCIAMNYLDRFLATPTGTEALQDRKIFQLVSMVCLYTAIKIHEPQAMEPSVVSSLSRGTYSEDEITDMERSILSALGWQMNPPTALSFVYEYMGLMPEGMLSDLEKAGIMDLAKFQTELAVSDVWFLGTNASTIALASLTNAMNFTDLSTKTIDFFISSVVQTGNICCDVNDLLDIEDKLFAGLEKSSSTPLTDRMSKKTVTKSQSSKEGCFLGSPRSVSAATTS